MSGTAIGDGAESGTAGGGAAASPAAGAATAALVVVDVVTAAVVAMPSGRLPFPIHAAVLRRRPRAFAGGWTLRAYSLASIPFGNWTREQPIPSVWSFFARLSAALSPASSRS